MGWTRGGSCDFFWGVQRVILNFYVPKRYPKIASKRTELWDGRVLNVVNFFGRTECGSCFFCANTNSENFFKTNRVIGWARGRSCYFLGRAEGGSCFFLCKHEFRKFLQNQQSYGVDARWRL